MFGCYTGNIEIKQRTANVGKINFFQGAKMQIDFLPQMRV